MIGFTGGLYKKTKSRGIYVICECGKYKEVQFSQFKKQVIKSCGCLRKEMHEKYTSQFKIDGLFATYHREYFIWQAMKHRVITKSSPKAVKNYQSIGITVCDEWNTSSGFKQFLEDMGRCPEGYELDRIDPTAGYSKENCRWVSRNINQFNKNLSDKNSTGAIGVGIGNKKYKYRAYITKDHKREDLGHYNSFEAALEARIKAELHLYGFVTKEKVNKYPDIVQKCIDNQNLEDK